MTLVTRFPDCRFRSARTATWGVTLEDGVVPMTNKPSYGQVRPDSGTREERYARTAQHQDRENRQTLHSSALSWSIPLRHLQLPRPRVGAFVFSALEGDHGTVLVGHMTILVGTASWTDKSLIESGKFYPPSAKDAETRLKYY